MTEKITEVVKHFQKERKWCCTAEQIQGRTVEETDVPVSRVKEEIIEVEKHVTQKRVPSCTVEHAVGVPVPQIRKENGEVIQLIPTESVKRTGQERVQNCTLEQIIDVTDLQIQEENEFIQLSTRDRISDCIAEQVNVALPKNRERSVEDAKGGRF